MDKGAKRVFIFNKVKFSAFLGIFFLSSQASYNFPSSEDFKEGQEQGAFSAEEKTGEVGTGSSKRAGVQMDERVPSCQDILHGPFKGNAVPTLTESILREAKKKCITEQALLFLKKKNPDAEGNTEEKMKKAQEDSQKTRKILSLVNKNIEPMKAERDRHLSQSDEASFGANGDSSVDSDLFRGKNDF